MKKQILFIITFFVWIFSLQGMLQRAALLRSQRTRRFSLKKPKGMTPVFPRFKIKQDVYTIPVETQMSSVPQNTGFFNWVSSFFVKNTDPELKTKGLYGIMHEVLYPQHEKIIIDRAGLTRTIRSFDKEDLEKAKERIETIINSDPRYKTSFVEENKSWFGKNEKPFYFKDLRTEESVFKTILWRDYRGSDYRQLFKGTILDEVLYKIFSGEDAIRFTTTLDKALNYLSLAQWLMDKGVPINPENQKKYMLAYTELMNVYKDLYRPKSFGRDTLRFLDEDSFKTIFSQLDPLLEKLITDQSLKLKLYSFQKERKGMQDQPDKYRKKFEEDDKREDYIWKKIQQVQWEYIQRTGDMNRDTSSFRSEVQFDEAEYEEWKQTGFLRGEKEALDREIKLSEDAFYNEIEALKSDFNLPSDATAEIMMQAVREYIKQKHPDRLKSKNISATKKEEMTQEYAEFIGKFDKVIEELKKREKIEKQNKQSTE